MRLQLAEMIEYKQIVDDEPTPFRPQVVMSSSTYEEVKRLLLIAGVIDPRVLLGFLIVIDDDVPQGVARLMGGLGSKAPLGIVKLLGAS